MSARRRSRVRIFLTLVSCLAGSSARPAFGQDSIEPDRPDVTNGAHLVGVGVLQFEVGGLYTRQSAVERKTGSPIGVRFGVRDWIEARASLDGWVSSTDVESRATGFGNVQLGAKIRLWSESDGQSRLSLASNVNLPTASAEKGLGSGQTDFTLAALTGFDVGPIAHLDLNYVIGAIGSEAGESRFVQHLASASLSVSVGRWSPFFETFAISRDRPDGGAIVAVNTGALYLMNPRLALDGGVEFGLSEDSPSFAAFAGFSVAFGASRAASRRSDRPAIRHHGTAVLQSR